MRFEGLRHPRPALVAAALVALLLGVAAAGYVLLDEGPATAQPTTAGSSASSSSGGSGSVAKVASEVVPSVVQIDVGFSSRPRYGARFGQGSSGSSSQGEEGIGSGVIYRSDGYIITAAHVVQNASSVRVIFADGSTTTASVVGTDPYTDIAVLKVNRNGLPAATFSSDRRLLVGERAIAVGSPSGLQSTVTSGIISGLNRDLPAGLTGTGSQEPSLTNLIQTDAAISPGNSGGALANIKGEVIGINEAYLPPGQTGAENIGFAIPSYTAISIADQIIQNGRATHPYLGVALTDLTPQIAGRFGLPVDSGALVTYVQRGGPAASAGIRRGDVIVGIGSRKVSDSGDLIAALERYRPGESVTLTVERGGGRKTVDVTLGRLSRSSTRS
ncbi:MAG: trypsin-like peptidase domain-containing protein [Rubrobacteraceae bacterium]|nr:trypsin-like peptidase domain-containing protein [Rubrobacteraceae bacterium]